MEKYICKNCKSDISHKPSNRRSFCNYDCFVEWQRKVHPRRSRTKRNCENCKSEFECIKSDKKRFCSRSCSASFVQIGTSRSEKTKSKLRRLYKDGKLTGFIDHQKRKKTILNEICVLCKNKFEKSKWSTKKYCSRECAYKRPGQGGYHPGSVRNFKSGWHSSPIAGKVWLDSSYEFIVANYLDKRLYKWIKNYQGFPYINPNGEQHNYIPDFYIEDLDLWVETKGYMTEIDRCKMRDFPHRIRLIGKKSIYFKETWGF